MKCAEKMNGEPGDGVTVLSLWQKCFITFMMWTAAGRLFKIPNDPVYSEDMFFGLGAEKENLHLLKDEDGKFLCGVCGRQGRQTG